MGFIALISTRFTFLQFILQNHNFSADGEDVMLVEGLQVIHHKAQVLNLGAIERQRSDFGSGSGFGLANSFMLMIDFTWGSSLDC